MLPREIEQLKQQLQQVRRASLLATRENDYVRIARLTTEAARLNRAIMEAEGQLMLEEA
ncbi:MAG: hypothetical protein AB1813_29140 [Verrucomicrobiota bacterium]